MAECSPRPDACQPKRSVASPEESPRARLRRAGVFWAAGGTWRPSGRRRKISEAADAVFAQWERIHRTYNPGNPDSLLALLSRKAPRGWAPLDEEAYALMERALSWHALTDGRFDVTFPPLWELWSRSAKAGREPSRFELAAAMALVGSDAVRLDPERRAVRFLKPLRLDFGGIGKDLALLRGTEVLERSLPGGTALLNLGGDMVAYGRKPGGWRIGVRHPLRGEGILGTLRFSAGAVLTSGCYERFVRAAGRDRCHILNAKTGQPLEDFSSLTLYLPSIKTAHHPSVVYALMGRRRGLSEVRSIAGAWALWSDLKGRVETAASPDTAVRWFPADLPGPVPTGR